MLCRNFANRTFVVGVKYGGHMKSQLSTFGFLIAFALLIETADSQETNNAKPPVTNSVGQKLQFIPAGSFVMGGRRLGPGGFFKDHPDYDGADERPLHPVRLTKPFYVASTEITVAQFRQFVEATNYVTTAETTRQGIVGFDPHEPEKDRRAKFAFRQKSEFTWKSPGFQQQDDHPVTGVSWKDAQAYCKWLSGKENAKYRLPTEAEWEYACRAGSQMFFAWGESYKEIHQRANIGNVEFEKAHPDRVYIQWAVDVEKGSPDPHVYTAPVGSYPANQWGLRDMHGNVWEWVQDVYIDTAYAKYKRPKYNEPIPQGVDPFNTEAFNEDGDWRGIRGGSWATSPLHCRSGIRSYYEASDAAAYLGFRIAREANAAEIAAAKVTFDREAQARALVKQAIGKFESATGTDLRVRLNGRETAEVTQALRLLPGLTEIHFSGSGKANGQLIRDITAVPGLRVLHLHNGGGNVTAADFAQLADQSELRDLHVSAFANLDDSSCDHLAGLKKLQELRLESNKITDAGLQKLTGLKNLTNLNIQATQSNGEVLTELLQAPLRRIAVNRISDEIAAQLKNFPNLTQLYVSDSSMSDTGFAAIAGLKRLESLRMRDCPNVSQAAFQAIAEMRSLTSLELINTNVGDDTLALLTNLQLHTLEINSENITDATMKDICSLITLNRLALGQKTKITDRGLKHFWRLNRLNRLDLFSAHITGSSFETITELPELYSFRLDSPALTDKAFEFLAEAPVINHIEIGMSRSENSKSITDEGVRYLSENTRWRHIAINRNGTAITDTGIEQLKNAFKKIRLDIRQ
jgi:formylglycine-generating enzyme required for sulfatase activity